VSCPCPCMGCKRAYKQGMLDAADVANDYAEERRSKLKGMPPTPGDDIAAALRVVAQQIKEVAK